MTLLLVDGCEDNSTYSTGTTAGITANGRNGKGLGSWGAYTVPSAARSTTITMGAAVFFASLVQTNVFTAFGSSADSGLRLLTDGSLRVMRSNTFAVGTSAAGVITANTWCYLEWQIFSNGTTGSSTVRVNGTVVLSLTNVNTSPAGATYDTINVQAVCDDLYFMSGSGDSFLGDITVETLYPNGDGAANQWLGSDGNSVANWQQVDETPVTTSDYNASSTVGQIDEYALTDLAHSSGTIVAVTHQATVALAAAGSQTFAVVNRRTADTVGTTQTATSTTYSGFHQTYTNDPETSAAWTITNVNALQTGVKVI